jgi:proteasome accessory factor B
VVVVDEVLAAKVAGEVGGRGSVEWCDDGSILVRLAVTHRPGFRSWVLGMLDHAEVVGPDELRDDLAGWLRTMAG